MDLEQLLKKIRPCDMNRPYAFVSYSSEDKERVWEDVVKLQSLGYNIWIDKEGLDAGKNSWRNDAEAAIVNFNCELLLYYVSANSLTSEGCYKECITSQSEEAKRERCADHPMDIIVIEVEPIEDISVLIRDVRRQIDEGPGSSKEKGRRARVIFDFKRLLFVDNDKIRIRAATEPDRIGDYYDDIVTQLRIHERKEDCRSIRTAKPTDEAEPEDISGEMEAEPVTQAPKALLQSDQNAAEQLTEGKFPQEDNQTEISKAENRSFDLPKESLRTSVTTEGHISNRFGSERAAQLIDEMNAGTVQVMDDINHATFMHESLDTHELYFKLSTQIVKNEEIVKAAKPVKLYDARLATELLGESERAVARIRSLMDYVVLIGSIQKAKAHCMRNGNVVPSLFETMPVADIKGLIDNLAIVGKFESTVFGNELDPAAPRLIDVAQKVLQRAGESNWKAEAWWEIPTESFENFPPDEYCDDDDDGPWYED